MEHNDHLTAAMPHQLILQDRRQLEMTGVSDVDSFDDSTVVAYTALGQLTVHGSGLHIRQLDLSSGSFSLEGQIDTLAYTEMSAHRGGFFGRLLR